MEGNTVQAKGQDTGLVILRYVLVIINLSLQIFIKGN